MYLFLKKGYIEAQTYIFRKGLDQENPVPHVSSCLKDEFCLDPENFWDENLSS